MSVVRPWSARIARVGIHSMELSPRVIVPAARITLFRPKSDVIKLTDVNDDQVGTVLHVEMTADWVYAFGLVTDTAIARGMNSGRLAPEFGMYRGEITTPATGVRHINAGAVSIIRALPNAQYIPGGTPLWSGLKFTTESTDGAL